MFFAFLLAAALLAATPGPGMAYVLARTVAGGRAEGLASCLGTAIGGLLHVGAAALGLSVLLAQSALAFSVVKYVGAAFLVYLGLRMLCARPPSAHTPAVRPRGARRALLEGALVEALNVKTALFFLAFLPQFIDPQGAVALQFVALGGVCVALNTLADVLVVLSTQRLLASRAHQAGYAGAAQTLSRVAGVILVALGAWLALARRSA